MLLDDEEGLDSMLDKIKQFFDKAANPNPLTLTPNWMKPCSDEVWEPCVYVHHIPNRITLLPVPKRPDNYDT